MTGPDTPAAGPDTPATGSPDTGAVPGYPEHAAAVPFGASHLPEQPATLYRAMRERHGPVVPVLLEGGLPAWLVLGYREIRMVAGTPATFGRDSRRWNLWDRVPPDWPLTPYVGWMPSIMFAEDDEHRRRAGAVSDALDSVDRTEAAAAAEQAADQLIDDFAGSDRADLITQYAHQVPLLVTARLFGMPGSGSATLAADIAASLGHDTAANAAHRRLREAMRDLVAGKRAEPGPDLPSLLLAHPADLSGEEIASDLLVVMTAAQQPTGDWIGNALRLMLVDDQFSVNLQGGRTSVAQALNEVLWKDTPVQNFIGRWAVHDCELGGRRIRRGDLLVLGLAAANADPRIHPDSAATFTGNRAHLSFGHGDHGCPYPAPELAEVIARTAVEVLLDRIPDVELAVPPGSLRWRQSIWLRGLVSLPVAFTPTAHVSGRTARAPAG